MPSVVTEAEPEWIPFRIRAGRGVELDPREVRLADVRQLTFDGRSDEPSLSPDGTRLVFRSVREGSPCPQVFTMDLGTGKVTRLSDGKGLAGRPAFVFPEGERVLYSARAPAAIGCPPTASAPRRYFPLGRVDLFASDLGGSAATPLLDSPGLDDDPSVALDGTRLVFTSDRDGDPELYTAKLDGTATRRITASTGFDGGARFSPDATRVVWHASRPEGAALERHRAGVRAGLLRPDSLEIHSAGVEGQNPRAITRNGMTNVSPVYLRDSRRVLFSSNLGAGPDDAATGFDLFVVDPEGPVTADGTPPPARVTFHPGLDVDPSFSAGGDLLVWTSDRLAAPGQTNVFVARWVEAP